MLLILKISVLLATSRSISFGEHRCDYPEIYGTSHFKMNDAFTPEKYCKRGAGGQAPGEHAVRSLCHAIAQPEDCGFDLANWYGIGEDIWRRCQNEPQTLKWRMPIATVYMQIHEPRYMYYDYFGHAAIFLNCTFDGIWVADQDCSRHFGRKFIGKEFLYNFYEIGSKKALFSNKCPPENIGPFDGESGNSRQYRKEASQMKEIIDSFNGTVIQNCIFREHDNYAASLPLKDCMNMCGKIPACTHLTYLVNTTEETPNCFLKHATTKIEIERSQSRNKSGLCLIYDDHITAAVNKQDVRQENSTKCRNFKILSETHFLTQIRLRTLQIKINIEARRNENCLVESRVSFYGFASPFQSAACSSETAEGETCLYGASFNNTMIRSVCNCIMAVQTTSPKDCVSISIRVRLELWKPSIRGSRTEWLTHKVVLKNCGTKSESSTPICLFTPNLICGEFGIRKIVENTVASMYYGPVDQAAGRMILKLNNGVVLNLVDTDDLPNNIIDFVLDVNVGFMVSKHAMADLIAYLVIHSDKGSPVHDTLLGYLKTVNGIVTSEIYANYTRYRITVDKKFFKDAISRFIENLYALDVSSELINQALNDIREKEIGRNKGQLFAALKIFGGDDQERLCERKTQSTFPVEKEGFNITSEVTKIYKTFYVTPSMTVNVSMDKNDRSTSLVKDLLQQINRLQRRKAVPVYTPYIFATVPSICMKVVVPDSPETISIMFSIPYMLDDAVDLPIDSILMSILTENRSDSFLSSLMEKDLAKKIQVSIKTEDILRKAIKLLRITVYTTEAGFLQSQLIIQFLFVHLKMIGKFSFNRWILIDFDELEQSHVDATILNGESYYAFIRMIKYLNATNFYYVLAAEDFSEVSNFQYTYCNGRKFLIEPIPKNFIQQLINVDTNNYEDYSSLHSIKIKIRTSQIYKDGYMTVWYRFDPTNEDFNVYFIISTGAADVKSSSALLIRGIYVRLLEKRFAESHCKYNVQIKQYSTSIYARIFAQDEEVSIICSGYMFSQFKIDHNSIYYERLFELVVQEMLCLFNRLSLAYPSDRRDVVGKYFESSMDSHYYYMESKEAVAILKSLTINNITDYMSSFFSMIHLKTVLDGHVSKSSGLTICKSALLMFVKQYGSTVIQQQEFDKNKMFHTHLLTRSPIGKQYDEQKIQCIRRGIGLVNPVDTDVYESEDHTNGPTLVYSSHHGKVWYEYKNNTGTILARVSVKTTAIDFTDNKNVVQQILYVDMLESHFRQNFYGKMEIKKRFDGIVLFYESETRRHFDDFIQLAFSLLKIDENSLYFEELFYQSRRNFLGWKNFLMTENLLTAAKQMIPTIIGYNSYHYFTESDHLIAKSLKLSDLAKYVASFFSNPQTDIFIACDKPVTSILSTTVPAMDLLALDFPVQLSNRAVPKVIENPIKELDFTIKKEVQSLMVICYHVSQVKGVTMAALYTLIHLIDYELNFNELKTIPSYARSIKYTDGQVVFYNIGTINSKRVQALFDKLLLELPDIIMRISDEELDSMKKMQAEHFKNTSGHVDFHWEAIVEGTYNFNLVEETAAAFRNLTKHMLVNVLKVNRFLLITVYVNLMMYLY